MKRAFVISPFSGSVARNIAFAERCCKFLTVQQGMSAFAGHIHYTRFLDDTVPEERQAGMSAAYAWLAVAHEAWVFLDLGVSRGMRADCDAAKRLDVPIVYTLLYDRSRIVHALDVIADPNKRNPTFGAWLHSQGLPHADYACATCHVTKPTT